MKRIALLLLLTASCGQEIAERPAPVGTEPMDDDPLVVGSEKYVCTMCDVYSDTAGVCSHCGMPLEAGEIKHGDTETPSF